MTNDKLALWSSLGPWHHQWVPMYDIIQIVKPAVRLGDGRILRPIMVATIAEDSRNSMELTADHAECIAHSTRMAGELLAARETIDRLQNSIVALSYQEKQKND